MQAERSRLLATAAGAREDKLVLWCSAVRGRAQVGVCMVIWCGIGVRGHTGTECRCWCQHRSWSYVAKAHFQGIAETERSLSLHFITFVSFPNHLQSLPVIAGRCSSHEAPNCAKHKEAALFIDSG